MDAGGILHAEDFQHRLEDAVLPDGILGDQ
jgi:hypothetical protein